MSRRLKVAALQKRCGGVVSPGELDRLKAAEVDLICLPEYFFIPDRICNQIETTSHRETILKTLETYSRRLVGTVVGGTLVEREGLRYYNACHVFDSGRYAGVYRKIHPTSHEIGVGIQPGGAHPVIEIRGIRLAVLICADVLFAESFYALAEQNVDLIAVPTTSPFLPDDTAADKERRDRDIYIEGARITGAHIVKACGVGFLMGKRLQGRSLICNRDGILAQVPIIKESLEVTLITEINFS